MTPKQEQDWRAMQALDHLADERVGVLFAEVDQLRAQVQALTAALASPEVAVWVHPGRHHGAPCVLGTRVPTGFIARCEQREAGSAVRAYPHLSQAQVDIAVWFETHYGPTTPKEDAC